MDRELWKPLWVVVKREARTLGRLPKARYSDALIVAMSLWHTASDRPMCWACKKEHYRAWFRPRKLPSVSQFTRRIATVRCQQLLQAVHEHLAQSDRAPTLSY